MGKLSRFLRIADLWLIGGAIYYFIEIIWRGYSHWTMFLLGGICFIIMGLINRFFKWETPLWFQCLISTGILLSLEFLTGCIVNLVLGWNVWSYSDKHLNLLGQICLEMIPLWYILSMVGIILDDYLRWQLFEEEKPRYKLF